MSKDLDKELPASEHESSKAASKEEAKAKKDNEKKSIKAAAAKKPKKSVVKFFKDARAEFKKVIWPAPKQVLNNTAVVLTCIVVSALAIWGVDSLFLSALRLLFKMS